MKRFLIHVDTNWCGEEDTFRAVAESEIELWDIAEQLAYDNFYSFGHDQDIAEEEGYDPDEMTGEDSVQSKIYDDKMFSATVDLKNIGGFCADAGMVAVFLLDEVLKYNPNFDYHINRLWTTTLIKDFDGEVEYYIDDAEGEAHIIGTGNVNFFTTQTGF